MPSTDIRPPSQAGRFYDARPDDLRDEVRRYINQAAPAAPSSPTIGAIAPHAGYTFSGPTAGHAWRALQAASPRRVFVLAPSHHAAMPLCSIWPGSAYETPLGTCPIDTQATEALGRRLPRAQFHERAERAEHALEVQVPFLQVALPQALLVPILVGAHGPAQSDELAQGIAAACDDLGIAPPADAAFLASSDAYHGHSRADCNRSDARLAEIVETMDVDSLYRAAADESAQACGLGPIATVMRLAAHYGAEKGHVLQRTNSAEAAPFAASGSYVVGYLAAVFH